MSYQYNKEQAEAIQFGAGTCMVLAPPGSGKTMVVTHRTQHLIEQYGVAPEHILVITFTRLAAKEMSERFSALTKGKNYPVSFGTFHSVFYQILKQEYGLNGRNLLAEAESKELLRQVMGQMYIESEIETEDDEELLSDLMQEVGAVKNGLLSLNEFKSKHLNRSEFEELFRSYEGAKKSMKKFDFDDMLVHTYALFRKYPEILQRWREKYRYILVDEFQDINKVQYEIVKMLAGKEKNLFVVGDDDQSIYSFRGSKPEFMRRMLEDYLGIKTITLVMNYRSTEFIIGAASRLIFQNENRFPKVCRTVHSKGKAVQIQELKDEMEEAAYIVGQIERSLEAGRRPEQIAVLYRAGMQGGLVAECLSNHNIPFQMKEHIHNFYQHFIVRDILAYMRLANGQMERPYFLMICNRPLRYLSRNSVSSTGVSFDELRKFYIDKEWMQDIIDQFDVDIRMMKNMAPYAAFQYIMKSVGYGDFLKQYAREQEMNEEKLLGIVRELEERCKWYRSYEDIFRHVEEYSKELEMQRKNTSNTKAIDRDKVQLMTMHASKGLEFEEVFILHSNEGEIPYAKAKSPEALEEERRMFYVAMTRAKKELTITYMKEKNGNSMLPSRFVNEIIGQTR